MLSAAPLFAQAATPPARFGIVDNSFLIEEAFNQEAGVVQHILVFQRVDQKLWLASFTDEWALGSTRHQLSATVPWGVQSGQGVMGDVILNYRFQLSSEGPGRAAIAPRLSLVAPTSSDSTKVGWQFNLPVSKQTGPVYLHGNAGTTVRLHSGNEPFLGGSVIAALTPMINLMLEGVVVWADAADEPATAIKTLSPGIRVGWNLAAGQLVVGVAAPITWASRQTTSLLGYVSFER